MNKIIREYWYVFGESDFRTRYDLVVDRETEKMLYGTTLFDGKDCGRFSVKKANLNDVIEFVDAKNGTCYRIQMIDDGSDIKKKARQILYDCLSGAIKCLKD